MRSIVFLAWFLAVVDLPGLNSCAVTGYPKQLEAAYLLQTAVSSLFILAGIPALADLPLLTAGNSSFTSGSSEQLTYLFLLAFQLWLTCLGWTVEQLRRLSQTAGSSLFTSDSCKQLIYPCLHSGCF